MHKCLALFFDKVVLNNSLPYIMSSINNPHEHDKQQEAHNDKEREKEMARKRKQAKYDAENADRELTSGKRTELDAAHGEDAIEIERNKGRRFEDSKEFTPFHGNLGDETEDRGDLSATERMHKNQYNAAASAGENQERKSPDDGEALQIKRGRKAGLSFDEKDSYVEDEEEKEK